MGNEKTDWMIYSDREMSVMSAQEEKVSFKELIKSLGMTQKEFSETFGIPMGTLRHWISGDRECPVYTKKNACIYGRIRKRLEDKKGMKNKILRTIQKVFCAVMMVVVIIISTVFILIAPIAKRVIRQNIFVAILTGGDIYRNHDNDFQDTFNEAYQYYDTELEEPCFDFDNQQMNQ